MPRRKRFAPPSAQTLAEDARGWLTSTVLKTQSVALEETVLEMEEFLAWGIGARELKVRTVCKARGPLAKEWRAANGVRR